MGTPVACTFANLFLALFEENYIYADDNVFMRHIKFYQRYIDDIVIIWDDSEKTFNEFVTHLNNKNSMNMVFTSVFGGHRLEFLDVLMEINNDKICTSMYRKPVAANMMMHFDSYHPVHTKRALPRSQFLRDSGAFNIYRSSCGSGSSTDAQQRARTDYVTVPSNLSVTARGRCRQSRTGARSSFLSWPWNYFSFYTIMYLILFIQEPRHLQGISDLEDSNIYSLISCKKLYNSPTDFGFCVKPNRVLTDSKELRFLCAEDEQTRTCWMTAFRLLKYGMLLYQNYRIPLQKTLHTNFSAPVGLY
ncbi:unnamed protein product [Ranitomeya imitator]|uniref:Reverse transcriptase domain-containing protein n=1 Tax=Ranitomeya imitator TaxID=111125 RepID=A0ABN9LYS8_9NEOB|nr:unnamed protein product [Ranitomeya imitator]